MDDWRRDPVHDCRPLPSRDAGMIRVMWIASGLFARYVTTVYDFSPVIVSDPCERMQVCGSRIMLTVCKPKALECFKDRILGTEKRSEILKYILYKTGEPCTNYESVKGCTRFAEVAGYGCANTLKTF